MGKSGSQWRRKKRKVTKVLCLNWAFHHATVWCGRDWEYFFFCYSCGSWFKDETLETSVLCSALFKSLQDKSIPVVSGCNSVQASVVAPAYTKAKFGSVWIQINSTFGNKNEKLGIFQHFIWNLITPVISLSNRFTAWKIFYSAINSVQKSPSPCSLHPSSLSSLGRRTDPALAHVGLLQAVGSTANNSTSFLISRMLHRRQIDCSCW